MDISQYIHAKELNFQDLLSHKKNLLSRITLKIKTAAFKRTFLNQGH